MRFETGEARLDSLDEPLDEDRVGLPVSGTGSGWYRIRVHARSHGSGPGVELNDQDLDEEPVEEHLIQSWPAPEAP
ncbi:hypothetical protein AB0I22_39505 [Streptomyces sp. NPDC050610]|uniref:hypothetical protein n=1 Tax=Streptomyces sp. NPDC050610 TaxID=3157097 RepID=UPI00343438B0